MSCRFEYAAKLICGFQDNPERSAVGFYTTTINIHNPWDREVSFEKKFALTFPRKDPEKEQSPGNVVTIPERRDVLGADEALAVDCVDIRGHVALPGFLEGFVVIQSQARLDVTAVYTVTGRDRRQPSIDVEQIRERFREG
jgi:hypothetical protein